MARPAARSCTETQPRASRRRRGRRAGAGSTTRVRRSPTRSRPRRPRSPRSRAAGRRSAARRGRAGRRARGPVRSTQQGARADPARGRWAGSPVHPRITRPRGCRVSPTGSGTDVPRTSRACRPSSRQPGAPGPSRAGRGSGPHPPAPARSPRRCRSAVRVRRRRWVAVQSAAEDERLRRTRGNGRGCRNGFLAHRPRRARASRRGPANPEVRPASTASVSRRLARSCRGSVTNTPGETSG